MAQPTHQSTPETAGERHGDLRHGASPVALALLTLIFFASPLPATKITVTGFDSTVADDGVCTLREAITAANTDTASGALAGECPAGSGADRIELTGNVTLTVVDNTLLGTVSGLPVIFTSITLDGHGYSIERDTGGATPSFGILAIQEGGTLRIVDTTIVNGGGAALNFGGGIDNQGTLTVVRCTLSGHSATLGGGAIVNSGSITLIDSVVSASSAADEGGGIYIVGGDLSLIDSTVAGNSSSDGGGIWIDSDASVTLTRSTVSANTATDGGGGILSRGTLRLTNSTISGNEANGGGGIAIEIGTATLTHCTVSGNDATPSFGGGIYVAGSGTLTLTSSIIANSTGGNCSGTISNGGSNMADDGTCGFPLSILTGFDTTLRDNGGSSQTHTLQSGSSAIGAAGMCGLFLGLFTDQRGALRDASCDVGAFEYGADDRYELSGPTGTDDTCWGHGTALGRAQRHLHTADADWINFPVEVGETYKIATSNLIGGADTVIELWDAVCSQKLDENDNESGGLLTSAITYQAQPLESRLSVAIKEVSSSYAPGRGYDVTVTCIAGCGYCSTPGFQRWINDERIFARREIEACVSIHALDTVVEQQGVAVFRAGNNVILGDGFQVKRNGTLIVEIDPNLQ